MNKTKETLFFSNFIFICYFFYLWFDSFFLFMVWSTFLLSNSDTSHFLIDIHSSFIFPTMIKLLRIHEIHLNITKLWQIGKKSTKIKKRKEKEKNVIKQSSYFGHLQTSRNNIVAFSIAVFLKVFTFLSMPEYFVFISVFQCFLTGVSFNLVRKRFEIYFSSRDSRKVQHSDYYRLPAQPLENIFITVFVIETIILSMETDK